MHRCLFSSVEGEEFCGRRCLSGLATFRSLVGFRLSVQFSSTVLIQLVETGCVLSTSGATFQCMATLHI